jgi:carbamoyltransferase
MKALGVHWTIHDNAAALVVDGEVVAAVEEERLSRQKHAPWIYPRRAIEWCLAHGRIDPVALDVVAIDFAPAAGALDVAAQAITQRAWGTLGAEIFRRGWAALAPQVIRRHLGSRIPAAFVGHQLAHAASAWFPSGLEHAAIIVVDGMGDFSCAGIFEARIDRRGPRIERRWANRFPHSLGLVYAAMTRYLGFRPFSDEYKVMGLAGHGRDRFRRELATLVSLAADGSFAVGRELAFRRDYSSLPLVDRSLEDLLGPRRHPDEPVGERHADIAASLQARLEEAMLALARKARKLVRSAPDLCLAGGVALNSTMNGRLRRDGPFARVYCGPAPHDAGCAIGAALIASRLDGDGAGADRRLPFSSRFTPYLGPEFDDRRIARAVDTSLLPSTRLADAAGTAAGLVAAGHAIGWMQGRLEIGPRALGNRSILADPRDPAVPAFLNRHVKQREEFRPFGPAVLEERAADLFALEGRSPYMQFTAPVHSSWRDRIPAVVHVDGTARVQTVSAADNPLFRLLLAAFDRLTGVPCILNTSLNSHGEPIANTPEDALGCFGRTGLRFLIMGDRLVAKSASDLARAEIVARTAGSGAVQWVDSQRF